MFDVAFDKFQTYKLKVTFLSEFAIDIQLHFIITSISSKRKFSTLQKVNMYWFKIYALSLKKEG